MFLPKKPEWHDVHTAAELADFCDTHAQYAADYGFYSHSDMFAMCRDALNEFHELRTGDEAKLAEVKV